eukprot:Protomagalhaensia_sp_Gyna_25__2358@NODE_22_length_7715_cov_56_973033_g15_i0_p5_GENE_NODE_22_length_7715_cov_56_973033_g15_i0NODE_22_length_7715_cov_56_973033_g15_i0_p5_ORF_typecomplete_len186_score29_51_NODE_22_length_7715_cov_56_973033_g15_i063606917
MTNALKEYEEDQNLGIALSDLVQVTQSFTAEGGRYHSDSDNTDHEELHGMDDVDNGRMTESQYRETQQAFDKLELLISRIDSDSTEKRQRVELLKQAAYSIKWGSLSLPDKMLKLGQPFQVPRKIRDGSFGQSGSSFATSKQSERDASFEQPSDGDEKDGETAEEPETESTDPRDLVYCAKIVGA